MHLCCFTKSDSLPSIFEGNIYQLLQSQAWRPSTHRWRSSASSERLTPFYYSQWLSHQTMICPYPLRESGETPYQIDPSPCTGVLREFWEWSPHGVAQYHAPSWLRLARWRATDPPRIPRSNGLWKATWMTKRHKMPFSLRTQVWTVLLNIALQFDFFSIKPPTNKGIRAS